MNRCRTEVLLAMAWWFWSVMVVAAGARGESVPPQIVSIHVGWDNVVKVGHWTRVRLEIQAGDRPLDATLQVWAPDGDGHTAIWQQEGAVGQQARVTAQAGQTVVVERLIRVGRSRGVLRARLLGDERLLAERAVHLAGEVRTVASTQAWLLTIGGDLPLEKVIERRRRGGEAVPWVSRCLDPTQMPTSALAYDGVDVVWLLAGERAFLERCSASQWEALHEWVSLGGKLILSLGRYGPTWGGENGPLRRLLPASVSGVVDVDEAPGLESYARADQPIGPFVAAAVDRPLAQVLAWFDRRSQGKRPAIVRYAVGMGQATWVLFDIDQPPFTNWSATIGMLAELWRPEQEEQRVAGRDELSRRVVHFGYDEMMGQLRNALDYFPATDQVGGVTVVSFTAVAVLLVLYVLWLGPGDYFLWRLLRRSAEWTWLSMPIGIALFCGVAYGLNSYWKKPRTIRLNQINVVDIDYVSGWARGTTWACVYSPQLRSYSVYVEARPAVPECQGSALLGHLTWQGLPGGGLGGLDTTGVETTTSEPYVLRMNGDRSSTRMIDVPVWAASTRNLFGQWHVHVSLQAEGGLWVDRNGILRGTFRNPLSVPLSNVVIAHGRWAYRIEGTLAPGRTVSLDGVSRRDLEWLLTRRRILSTQTSYAALPWDIQDRDVPRIMEILFWYAAAGGKAYTGLNHRYQHFTDWSGHLNMGRVVVVGQATEPAARIRSEHADGESASWTEEHGQTWTWYRLLLPVERWEGVTREAIPQ